MLFKKTSKPTTHNPLISILTTRQAPTSKSTTRKGFSVFRHVPLEQKKLIFSTMILNVKSHKRLISGLPEDTSLFS